MVLGPFWALATKPEGKAVAGQSGFEPSRIATEVCKTTALNVHAAPALEKRSARSKASIVLKTICLTNKEVVPKGSRLIVSEKLPVKLPE